MISSGGLLTEDDVKELRSQAQATWAMADEVLRLRADNARLRDLLRQVLNVGEKPTGIHGMEFARARAEAELEEPAS